MLVAEATYYSIINLRELRGRQYNNSPIRFIARQLDETVTKYVNEFRDGERMEINAQDY